MELRAHIIVLVVTERLLQPVEILHEVPVEQRWAKMVSVPPQDLDE